MKLNLFATGFLILGILFFYSCTNVKDYWLESDNAPQFKFTPSLTDTVTDSIKVNTTCVFSYKIIDEEHNLVPTIQKNIAYQYTIDSINQTISIKGLSATNAMIPIKVKDAFGKTSTAIIKAIIFTNLSPVAVLSYNLTKDGDGNNFVNFIASDSYDRDKRFGGTVVAYEYSLDGYLISTNSLSTLTKDISSGNHIISLRVQDNDGAWSTSTYLNIVVN